MYFIDTALNVLLQDSRCHEIVGIKSIFRNTPNKEFTCRSVMWSRRPTHHSEKLHDQEKANGVTKLFFGQYSTWHHVSIPCKLGTKKIWIIMQWVPLTVISWPTLFLKKNGPMLPPTQNVHQTIEFSNSTCDNFVDQWSHQGRNKLQRWR